MYINITFKTGSFKVAQKVAANGAITYYKYFLLGNMINKWKPISVVNGTLMFSWTGYTYDKAGRMTEKKAGKPLVDLYDKTDDAFTTTNKYEKG